MSRAKVILINWLVALSLAVAFFCLVFFARGLLDFTGASDACFFTGIFMLGIAGLYLIVRTGLFDTVGYGFANFFSSFKKGTPKKYQDAYQYKTLATEKRNKRKPYVISYFVVAGVLLILALAFMTIALNSITPIGNSSSL